MVNNELYTIKRPAKQHFTLMVVGQVISIMGAALLRFGLSLYILDTTGRADLFGMIYAVSNIPILLSPFGGALADRFPRKNLMVIFDFTSGAILFLLMFFIQNSTSAVVPVAAAMILLGLVSAFYQPTVQASIPSMVHYEKIESANGLVNGVGALAQLAAPLLGGLIYGVLGITRFIFCCGVAFICSAVMEIFIQIPFEKREWQGTVAGTIMADMKDGVAYIKKRSVIVKLVGLAALFNLVLTPFFLVGTPIVLRTTLGATNAQTGVGIGVIQLSTILGALLVGLVAKYIKLSQIYVWVSGMAVASVLIILGLSPWVLGKGFYPAFLLFLSGVVVIAMLLMVISIYVLSSVQKNTPTQMLGKVMATITAVSQCVAPVGQLFYGWLFTVSGTRAVIPAVALFVMIISLCALSKQLLKNEAELS